MNIIVLIVSLFADENIFSSKPCDGVILNFLCHVEFDMLEVPAIVLCSIVLGHTRAIYTKNVMI